MSDLEARLEELTAEFRKPVLKLRNRDAWKNAFLKEFANRYDGENPGATAVLAWAVMQETRRTD